MDSDGRKHNLRKQLMMSTEQHRIMLTEDNVILRLIVWGVTEEVAFARIEIDLIDQFNLTPIM